MGKRKKYDYHKGFIKLSEYSLRCSEMLNDILLNYNEINRNKKIIEMHKIEQEADDEKHDMMNCLMKEFLPPIEREDIINLANRIDDVTDYVEDVLIHLDIYHVKKLNPEIIKFSQLIVECCKNLKETLKEFTHFKKSSNLQDKIIEINCLEEEGDTLYADTVRKLYKSSKDPIELLIWTEIFARLEKCFDACKDVADGITAIVINNS